MPGREQYYPLYNSPYGVCIWLWSRKGSLSSHRNIAKLAREIGGNTGLRMPFIWAKSVKNWPQKMRKTVKKRIITETIRLLDSAYQNTRRGGQQRVGFMPARKRTTPRCILAQHYTRRVLGTTRAEGAQAVRYERGWSGELCGYTRFRDTGVFVMEQGFLWVTNRYGNKPTELIKSHAFFWCQMWDVTCYIEMGK